MLVRKLRLQKGWSQEQLAELAGLSVRTIQRIERGQKPAMESARSLASVFEVDLSIITEGNTTMGDEVELKPDERDAMRFVRGVKEFYTHLLMFLIFVPLLLFFNGPSEPLVLWGLLGWGVGVIIHGLVAYEILDFFGPGWEKKQIEKRLGRRL